jgi:hypothetical protein
MKLGRHGQFWLLLIGLPVLIFALLALALLGLEPDRRCTMQFPKVLGCLLSRHENLAGGLIAASGAIFAAWLAWTAVRDQTAVARRQIADDRAAELERQRTPPTYPAERRMSGSVNAARSGQDMPGAKHLFPIPAAPPWRARCGPVLEQRPGCPCVDGALL